MTNYYDPREIDFERDDISNQIIRNSILQAEYGFIGVGISFNDLLSSAVCGALGLKTQRNLLKVLPKG
jgi:hypothetical protein